MMYSEPGYDASFIDCSKFDAEELDVLKDSGEVDPLKLDKQIEYVENFGSGRLNVGNCRMTTGKAPNTKVRKPRIRYKRYDCSECGKIFTDPSNFNRHKKCHYGQSSKYECAHCDASYTRKLRLKYHLERHVPGLVNFYVCSHCGKCFRDLYELNQHEFVHWKATARGGKWPFQCGNCERSFQREMNLKRHQRNEHSKILKGFKYECADCGVTYAEKRSLKYHVARHSSLLKNDGDNVSKRKVGKLRDVCGHVARHSYDLKIHRNSYNCGASSLFPSRVWLRRARKERKRVICHICGHEARDSYDLKIHQNSYKCRSHRDAF